MAAISPETLRVLCLILSGKGETVSWHEFSLQDWERMVTTARIERMAPLLCHIFRRTGWPDGMPENLRAVLLRDFYNSAAQGDLYFRELERVLSEFHRAEIAAVLLKGAALATTLYPDVAVRPMGDVDLLVRQADLSRAIDVVEKLGYAPENPSMRRGLEYLVFYEANFRGGEHLPVPLELHWNLMGGANSRYRPPLDWFWAQTRTIRFGDSSALVFTPTAHLLHAAAHLALKHGGDDTRLLWLYDLHLIIVQSADLNWTELVSKGREANWALALHTVLDEVQRLFLTPVPAWVMDALAEKSDPEAGRLMERMAAPDLTRTSGAWNHLAFLSGTTRLRWLAAVIAPDPVYMQWRYQPKPTWLWPLYYFVRWFDMLQDGLSTVGQRLTAGRRSLLQRPQIPEPLCSASREREP